MPNREKPALFMPTTASEFSLPLPAITSFVAFVILFSVPQLSPCSVVGPDLAVNRTDVSLKVTVVLLLQFLAQQGRRLSSLLSQGLASKGQQSDIPRALIPLRS